MDNGELYLIEILHQTTTIAVPHSLVLKLYLIEILHQTTTVSRTWTNSSSCILSKFYIKPQRGVFSDRRPDGCILSKFYIKPQRKAWTSKRSKVVSYRNSTSNHNCFVTLVSPSSVVSYRNSTSNHNKKPLSFTATMLYLIEILHQTTTLSLAMRWRTWLYLIEILHQTTTITPNKILDMRCILSKFYIKPQPSPQART